MPKQTKHTRIKIGNYTFIDKSNMSIEEWLAQRTHGIGGSEIGTILNVNPYQSSIRLFYEKVGLHAPKNLEKNASIFWGRISEANILDASQYWDHTDPLQYTLNYSNGDRQATHMELDFFTLHNKYDWFQANVDGIGWSSSDIDPNQVIQSLSSGKLIKPEKIIEIKTINSRARDKWKGGIPYGYFLQVMAYMMVWKETNPELYGEIYSLVDGNNLECHRVDWDQELADQIEQRCSTFWHNIEKAKKVIATETNEEVIINALLDLEPEPDGSEDYYKFLSEKELKRLAETKKKKTGPSEALQAAREYQRVTEALADLEGKKQFLKNKVTQFLRQADANELNFGEDGYIRYNKKLTMNIH